LQSDLPGHDYARLVAQVAVQRDSLVFGIGCFALQYSHQVGANPLRFQGRMGGGRLAAAGQGEQVVYERAQPFQAVDDAHDKRHLLLG